MMAMLLTASGYAGDKMVNDKLPDYAVILKATMVEDQGGVEGEIASDMVQFVPFNGEIPCDVISYHGVHWYYNGGKVFADLPFEKS